MNQAALEAQQVAALWTSIAALVAAGSACVSLGQLWFTRKAVLRGFLREQTSEYLKNYTELHDRLEFDLEGYSRLKAGDRVRLELLAGQLVGVIDLMFESGDKRAPTWAGYLTGFPGPLVARSVDHSLGTETRFGIEAYATHPKTKLAIDRARQAIETKQAALLKSTLASPTSHASL